MNNELKGKLKALAEEGYVLIGVGSRVKGDDAFGSLLAGELSKIDPERFFDASTAPENYAYKAAKTPYKNVIIVDVCWFEELEPGAIRLVSSDKLEKVPVPSTHGPTLQLTVNFLTNFGKSVWVIGIKPETTTGEGLSPSVQKTYDELLTFFMEVENA